MRPDPIWLLFAFAIGVALGARVVWALRNHLDRKLRLVALHGCGVCRSVPQREEEVWRWIPSRHLGVLCPSCAIKLLERA
jgi:hypothetical protein